MSQEVELDKKYTIKIVEPNDRAAITFEGFTYFSNTDKIGVFQTTLEDPSPPPPHENYFPYDTISAMIVIVMASAILTSIVIIRKRKINQKGQE